jgi:phosphatidylglycerophosphate synthase
VTSDSDRAPVARRPLRTRSRPQAAALAGRLVRRGVSPNAVSVASVILAAGAGASLIAVPRVGEAAQIGLLVAAAVLIQLRLLANLIDGLMAIEGGRKTPTGDLYNEIPDRVADTVILVAAGYAATWLSWGDAIGWAAATAAVATAYVRVLGGSLGAAQHFVGPMAKPHRMAVLTVACLASVVEVAFGYSGRVLTIALAAVVVGSLATFARRTLLIAEELRAR